MVKIKKEDKNFIIELLEVYRSLPALWYKRSKEYNDKHIKNAQYEILLEKYKEQYPNAGKRELWLKINSLRTNYRKELERIASLEKSDAGVDDKIESNLFYFDAINFLRKNEEPCTSRTTLNLSEKKKEYQTPQKRKNLNSDDDHIVALATKQLQQGQNRFEKLAEAWAVQLLEMDPRQRTFAEKFIGDILFEAKMGTLHRNAISFNTFSNMSDPLQDSMKDEQ